MLTHPQQPTEATLASAATAVQLSDEVRAQICRLCEAAYPIEACGVLFGLGDGERTPWRVTGVRAARNQHGDDRRCHYLVAWEFQLSAEREARRAGEEVVGYYHSHADCEALPSDCDREHAWPGYLYVICSVVKAQAVGLGLFALSGQGGPFSRIRVEPARPLEHATLEVP